jgi:hypothetical protein
MSALVMGVGEGWNLLFLGGRALFELFTSNRLGRAGEAEQVINIKETTPSPTHEGARAGISLDFIR